MNKFIYILFFGLLSTTAFSQQEIDGLIVRDTIIGNDIDPLTPAKAAFYSVILPGLGQAYNKKYWKIPIVYIAMGSSIYFYVENNKNYNLYRDAYKQRLAGQEDDFPFLDNPRLINAQRQFQRNRDLSLIVTAIFYLLNVVDANVDAHLIQFNVNDNLSFAPSINTNDINYKPMPGFTLKYAFK